MPTAEEIVGQRCWNISEFRRIIEFWSRVPISSMYSCWEWEGTRSRTGYGLFSFKGKYHSAHRLAYEWLRGPIPVGLTLDHLCRNPLCVNPDHLEPVTHQVNILRGTGRSAQNARKTHCPSGHQFDEQNTYRYDGQRHCRVCRRATHRRWKERQRA